MFAVHRRATQLPKRLRDPSNSSSGFGRPVETFVFSEYLCMRRIRGFGEDVLYRSMFYITSTFHVPDVSDCLSCV